MHYILFFSAIHYGLEQALSETPSVDWQGSAAVTAIHLSKRAPPDSHPKLQRAQEATSMLRAKLTHKG